MAADATSEEAATALMGTYVAHGQRHLVARAYQRCRDGLKELGLEPSASLEIAYRDAMSDGVTVGLSRPAATANATSNLPRSLSSFIGRDTELAEVCPLVRTSALVTLLGMGGSGKTRLALEVARRLEPASSGAYLVELAPVVEAGQVPRALSVALGVREQSGRTLTEVLAEALSGQDLLIVIDNCEHVIDGVAELSERLNRACPRLRLLVTSREPLRIDGERVYRLGPLSLPSQDTSVADLERSDAVKLFVERGPRPQFDLRRRGLDGLTGGIGVQAPRRDPSRWSWPRPASAGCPSHT